jgi:uncharacterized oligopeptide transporter (OPT) family protein
MTILENNCMQSTASVAGYSTGGTLGSAFAAYMILSGHPLPLPLTWRGVFFLAVLGVTMAVPLKKQMINIEQLPFPSGIAAAETLRALHAHGSKGLRAAHALGLAALVGALDKFWAEGLVLLSAKLAPFTSAALLTQLEKGVFGPFYASLKSRTVMFTWDAIFVAAGAIMGLRICVTLFVSGTLCWGVFVPLAQRHGLVTGSGFRELVQYTLWGGTSCMVASSLLNFLLQWETVKRAFKSLGGIFRRGTPAQTEMEKIETPMSWFAAGQLVSLVALAWLAHASFAMPWWQSALAVVLSFVLSLVACRITGETDTTPIGALGKVAQLTFGALNPGNCYVNLMAANITAGAATSSADLLTDLKSGYLLGAHPRKQFLAQFAGIFVGTLVTVLCFSVLIPNPAAGLRTVSRPRRADVGGGGQGAEPGALRAGTGQGVVDRDRSRCRRRAGAAAAGAAEALAAVRALGLRLRLAWVFDWYYGLLFLLGALAAAAFKKRSPERRGGVHDPRGLRRDRRRFAHGRGARLLGKRRRVAGEDIRTLIPCTDKRRIR